jgi:hypothetical protein
LLGFNFFFIPQRQAERRKFVKFNHQNNAIISRKKLCGLTPRQVRERKLCDREGEAKNLISITIKGNNLR